MVKKKVAIMTTKEDKKKRPATAEGNPLCIVVLLVRAVMAFLHMREPKSLVVWHYDDSDDEGYPE